MEYWTVRVVHHTVAQDVGKTTTETTLRLSQFRQGARDGITRMALAAYEGVLAYEKDNTNA